MLFYSVAGLVVASEIPLPGVEPLDRAPEAAVRIRLQPVPSSFSGATKTGPNWSSNGSQLLLSIPGLASFLLVEGREIAVALADGRRAEDAGPFLAQNLLGLLIQQRGRIVLKASAVAIDGRALLFCGPAGAGKSTLAAAMTRRGHCLLADGFCSLAPSEEGTILVDGDGVRSMLWADSIHALDLQDSAGHAVRRGIHKYYMRPAAAAIGALPLAAIYSLAEDRRTAAWHLDAVRGLRAVRAIREAAYRLEALATIDQRLRFFHASAAIAGKVPVVNLTRGPDFDWIDDCAKHLEGDSAKLMEEKEVN